MSGKDNALSPEKQYLLTLSDEEIRMLINAVQKSAKSAKVGNASGGVILPASAKQKLSRLRKMPEQMKPKDDALWQEYTEAMLKLQVKLPGFYKDITDRQMYRKLRDACKEHMLPESFAEKMIPCVMEYVHTGYMTSVLLAGSPGCGKTTAAKILAEIMSLDYTLISAPAADTNHGLGGDASSFVGADIGMIARSQLDHQRLNPMLIIDEVEKAPHPFNRTALADELLSVCDRSGNRFTDNYLGYPTDASSCVFIMTCNDLDKVSAPLQDRVDVFEFPDVEEERMERMMLSYYEEQVKKKFPDMFDMNPYFLMEATCSLYNNNVHSIRQHQKLVDNILRNAYLTAMNQENDGKVIISRDMIHQQLEKMGCNKKRRIGF